MTEGSKAKTEERDSDLVFGLSRPRIWTTISIELPNNMGPVNDGIDKTKKRIMMRICEQQSILVMVFCTNCASSLADANAPFASSSKKPFNAAFASTRLRPKVSHPRS